MPSHIVAKAAARALSCALAAIPLAVSTLARADAVVAADPATGHATANLDETTVTARSLREDIITALDAGVNNYIVKPFTPQLLKDKIDSLIVTPAA